MPSTAADYRNAGLERMGDAAQLKRLQRYPFAMCAAGVAVVIAGAGLGSHCTASSVALSKGAMTKALETNWTVLPHGPIERLEDNLWRVEGSLPRMPLKRVMTLARLASGDLLIHNPIALEPAAMTELDALGRVAFIVVPNGWHRLDLRAFHARYRAAQVLAPAGSRKKIAEIEPSASELASLPADPNISLCEIDGTGGQEAVMSVRASGGVSVVFADAIFNMPHLAGLQGFVLRKITGSSGGPRVARVARWLLIKDKAAFAAHLERLATPDLRRVIVAHHQTITDDPAGVLRRIAASVR